MLLKGRDKGLILDVAFADFDLELEEQASASSASRGKEVLESLQ